MSLEAIQSSRRNRQNTKPRVAAMWLSYLGTRFAGYQVQPNARTVQKAVEETFRKIGLQRNPVSCARTDSGVHARMHVISFRVTNGIACDEIVNEFNRNAPEDLSAIEAQWVDSKFSATWNVVSKEYRYRISQKVPTEWKPYCLETEFNFDALRDVLNLFEGRHNFRAFHKKSSSEIPRTIESINVELLPNDIVDIHFSGEGFARYQIRQMLGAALRVSNQTLTKDEVLEALKTGVPLSNTRISSHGLCLWSVNYGSTLQFVKPAPTRLPFATG